MGKLNQQQFAHLYWLPRYSTVSFSKEGSGWVLGVEEVILCLQSASSWSCRPLRTWTSRRTRTLCLSASSRWRTWLGSGTGMGRRSSQPAPSRSDRKVTHSLRHSLILPRQDHFWESIKHFSCSILLRDQTFSSHVQRTTRGLGGDQVCCQACWLRGLPGCRRCHTCTVQCISCHVSEPNQFSGVTPLQSCRSASSSRCRTRPPWRRAEWCWTAPCPTPAAAFAGTRAPPSSCRPSASRSAVRAATGSSTLDRWHSPTPARTASRWGSIPVPPTWRWKVRDKRTKNKKSIRWLLNNRYHPMISPI